MFAILLILNACGSHETPAPAEPSEPSETLETTETTEDTEVMDSSESSEPSETSESSEPTQSSEPAGSASGDAASETQEGSAQSDTPADTDADVSGPAASKESSDPLVYFTSDISAEGLVRIYESLGWDPQGKPAVKISTGEPPASNSCENSGRHHRRVQHGLRRIALQCRYA